MNVVNNEVNNSKWLEKITDSLNYLGFIVLNRIGQDNFILSKVFNQVKQIFEHKWRNTEIEEVSSLQATNYE